jgi:hypothetical protein
MRRRSGWNLRAFASSAGLSWRSPGSPHNVAPRAGALIETFSPRLSKTACRHIRNNDEESFSAGDRNAE